MTLTIHFLVLALSHILLTFSAHKRAFALKRKEHYNEGSALRAGRVLLDKDPEDSMDATSGGGV